MAEEQKTGDSAGQTTDAAPEHSERLEGRRLAAAVAVHAALPAALAGGVLWILLGRTPTAAELVGAPLDWLTFALVFQALAVFFAKRHPEVRRHAVQAFALTLFAGVVAWIASLAVAWAGPVVLVPAAVLAALAAHGVYTAGDFRYPAVAYLTDLGKGRRSL